MAYSFKHGDRPIEGVTIQRAVGRGGFGEVYYALTDSGKQIAVKYLRDNAEVELRGISNVLNLKSPYLITIFDVKQDTSGEPFVIMEYIGGPSLRDLMNAEPTGMPLPKVAYFLHGIGKGLAYLHDRGIVHRDLKPANIFYDDGFVKIGDYGLSKHMSVSRHSAQTMSVGTVHYMAPEIGSGHYTKAIDVYALGVILYEMITGRLPFSGASMGEILMKHLSEKPNLVGIPEPFATVIGKALAKDPAERYQDASEMLNAVMASSEVKANVVGFDPSGMTQVLRAGAGVEPDPTLTAGGFRVPPPNMDAREAGAADWRANVREWREKFRGQMRDFKDQMREVRAAARDFRKNPPLQVTPGRSKFSRFMTVFVVALAISFAFVFLQDNDRDAAPMIIALMFFFLGGPIASLVTHRWMRNHEAAGTIIERILYGGVGLAFMSIGLGPASAVRNGPGGPNGFAWVLVAPVVAMTLCNWGKRVQEGRRGHIRLGDAIMPAIVGGFAAMSKAPGYEPMGAGIAATISLLTQAMAAAWPEAAPTRKTFSVDIPIVPPVPPGRPGAPAPDPIAASVEVKPGGVVAGVVIGRRGWGRRVFGLGCDGKLKADVQTSSEPAAGAPRVVPIVVDATQPSFVGRAANAGLSFAGKFCLLAALTVAFLSHGIPHRDFSAVVDGNTYDVVGSTVKITRPGEEPKVIPLNQVEPVPIAILFMAGAAMLVVARRRDGAGHVVRGLVGCALGFTAATLAMRNGGANLRALMDGGPIQVRTIAPMICFAGTSLFLLFWPRPRNPRTIVV